MFKCVMYHFLTEKLYRRSVRATLGIYWHFTEMFLYSLQEVQLHCDDKALLGRKVSCPHYSCIERMMTLLQTGENTKV